LTSKYNDLDFSDWKNLNIDVNSLWIINKRDKSGKHKNIYHGNFIPQIPNHLIRRYTKTNEVVLEPFMGSGTTLFECENLHRKYIGFDINVDIVQYVNDAMKKLPKENFILCCLDSSNKRQVDLNLQNALKKINAKKVQFLLMHPPYMDIVKFTDNQNDLSQISDVNKFMEVFKSICENHLNFLDENRYFAVVIGDVYKNSEVVPLGFYCLDMIKKSFKVKLKGIIVKNIEGNRGKLGINGIWCYRALKSDYYIFKHEYIFVFKKEF
jgi:16S rRNA G966 N2-methylase RsmD